jgi:PPOX class probable F420-dependent enzyme
MSSPIDESTPFGERAAKRLREDLAGWVVTVSKNGTPQPVPVWFLWDGTDSIVCYSQPNQPKLANIERSPEVAFHLDGNRKGENIIVCLGKAQLIDEPSILENAPYMEKYGERIGEIGQTPERFGELFTAGYRISITRVRGM